MLRKKFIALICIVGLSFSLTACGAAEKSATSEASNGSSKSGSFLQNLAGGSKTDSAGHGAPQTDFEKPWKDLCAGGQRIPAGAQLRTGCAGSCGSS